MEFEPYRNMFIKMPHGIIVTDREGNISDLNEATEGLLGYRKDDLISKPLSEIIFHEDVESDNNTRTDLLSGFISQYYTEKRLVRSDFITIWVQMIVYFIVNKDSEKSLIYILEDISARKSADMHLRHVSTHDMLTGLYNRAYFELEISSAESGLSLPMCIIIIDLDGLKKVNDSVGHEAGDYLIIGAAKILKESFRCNDTVCRIGGDEFVILLSETNEDTLANLIEKLQRYKERYNSSNPKYKVEFSVGAAIAYTGKEVQSAIRRADEQMYADKRIRKTKIIENGG